MKSPKSHAETMRDNAKAMRRVSMETFGIFHNKPAPDLLPEKLSRKKSAVQLPKRTEADVKHDGLSLLHRHPKVASVEQYNNGAAQFGNHHVKFNRVRVKGMKDVRMVDCKCLLKNGGTLAIDWKHPDWQEPDWDKLQQKELREGMKGMLSQNEAKELAQYKYLSVVNSLPNGCGLFISDVGVLLDALEII